MIKEFVHKFCLAAREAGIEKLNFYIEENQRRDISVYEDTLEHLSLSEAGQLSVEGLVDGKAGSVFIENLDESLIPDYLLCIQETASISTDDFVPYALEGLSQASAADFSFTDLDATQQAMCNAAKTAASARVCRFTFPNPASALPWPMSRSALLPTWSSMAAPASIWWPVKASRFSPAACAIPLSPLCPI